MYIISGFLSLFPHLLVIVYTYTIPLQARIEDFLGFFRMHPFAIQNHAEIIGRLVDVADTAF